jgi:hypothetical protein
MKHGSWRTPAQHIKCTEADNIIYINSGISIRNKKIVIWNKINESLSNVWYSNVSYKKNCLPDWTKSFPCCLKIICNSSCLSKYLLSEKWINGEENKMTKGNRVRHMRTVYKNPLNGLCFCTLLFVLTLGMVPCLK